jgi:hypothetical protein
MDMNLFNTINESPDDIIARARCRQTDITEDAKGFGIFYGRDNDLYIALPHRANLTKNYKIYFFKQQPNYLLAKIYSGNYCYDITITNEHNLLFMENGYHAIKGKYPHHKGLHNQLLYKLAYIAFYGNPPPTYQIHHIDRNKQNNSMDNLVALTEEEHSAVHNRDLSFGRTLFNKPTQTNLLSALQEEAIQSRAVIEDKTILEDQVDGLLEGEIAKRSSQLELLEALGQKATKTNITKIIKKVDLKQNTVLAHLLKLYVRHTKK